MLMRDSRYFFYLFVRLTAIMILMTSVFYFLPIILQNGVDAANDETYLGCYVDQSEHRLLNGESINLTNLTPSSCVNVCSVRSYPYAGLEYGNMCYCGYYFPPLNVRTLEKDCNLQCPGDSKLSCGGTLRLAAYETGVTKKNTRPRSVYLGCYKDTKLDVDQRNFSLLKGFENDYGDDLTPNLCDELCYKNGFLYFGLTLGTLCYCGDQKMPRSLLQPEDKCYRSCRGDNSKKCGGKWEFSVYSTGITDMPIDRNYLGCAKDPGNKLTPEYSIKLDTTNSPRRCANICGQLGYAFSGVEDGEKCYCSNGIPEASFRVEDNACHISPCPGNPVDTCGDKEKIKVYNSTFANGIQKVGMQKFLGCYVDDEEHRILDGSSMAMNTTLTPVLCVELCLLRGYPFAGLENGVMCYCGHQFPSRYVQTSESECNAVCSGNTGIKCGGFLMIAVYETGLSKINSRPRSTYLGCYHDHKSFFEQRNSSLLKGVDEDYEEMLTVDFCDELCYKNGFLYFGMTTGHLCYCGDQKPPQTVLLSEDECYKHCTGEAYKFCGGNWEFSMYSTGIIDLPIKRKYLGCVKNPSDKKLQPEFKKRYESTNSARRCVNICGQLGYKFSGVEDGADCYCSDGLPDLSTRDADSACNIVPCAGDPNHNCGDKERLMVFSTYADGVNTIGTPSYLGCYTDQEYHRILDGTYDIMNNSQTPDMCIQRCLARYYPFAGLENGNTCYCGHHFPSINIRTVDSQCNSQCSGDASKTCGGTRTLAAYATGLFVIDSRPRSIYLGCYHDHKEYFEQKNNSLLKGYWEDYDQTLTPKLCDELCYKNGFLYFGMTVGNYCYCGDQQPAETTLMSDDECYSNCLGESYYMCGGKWEFSIYSTGITDFPINDKYLKCVKDDEDRYSSTSEFKMQYDAANSPRRCVNICDQLGYSFSGIKEGNQCLCFNTIPPDSAKDDDSTCAVSLCPGDPRAACGNKDRIKTFKAHEKGVKWTQAKKYIGCYIDQVDHRVLDGSWLQMNTTLTPALCVSICFQRGYPFAGTEEGKICYCGHHFPSMKIATSDSECNIICSGDSSKFCGGSLKIAVYETGVPKINARPRSVYLGCYHDHKPTLEEKEKSILKGYWEDFDETLTPKVCDETCYNYGFLYFGMIFGNFCYCGDQKPLETDLLPDKQCYMYCPGEIHKRCGGNWHFSIYATGIIDAPLNGKYLGCVKNPAVNSFIIEFKQTYKITNTPRRCVNICKLLGYKYSGVENGETCYCSNTEPPTDLLDKDFACNVIPCPGDGSQTCGNRERIKVYSIYYSEVNDTKFTTQVPVTEACEKSVTLVNRLNVCTERVFFVSNFTNIDTNVWNYAVKMPSYPDYAFVRYEASTENIYTAGGKLFIRPTLLSEDEVMQGSLIFKNCTGSVEKGECSRTAFSYNILPPVRSAEISTEKTLSFRYGILNINMTLPSGDWIVPYIWLVKKNDPSVRIKIVSLRGNRQFSCNGTEMGSTLLEGGLYVASASGDTVNKVPYTFQQSASWSDTSHLFTLTWTRDYISIFVDEQLLFLISGDEFVNIRQLLKTNGHSGSKLYPFDDEFYLVLGVSVGGITDFPDGCSNNGKHKPWTNNAAKALLRFWEDRHNWHQTWNSENAALRIDEISMTAL